MLSEGIHRFQGQRVLLLQGPVGPFFARLADDLRSVGATVHKVNFHSGDWLFYPKDSIAFRHPMAEWPAFFEALLEQLRIDAVLLFGDCRWIHTKAHAIAHARGVEVGVFEEGYLRPQYITLERHGVNGHSTQPRSPLHYLNQPRLPDLPAKPLGNTFWPMVWWGFCYFGLGALGRPWFPHYQHHRKLSLWEGLPWIRSAWRKRWYRWRERKVMPELMQRWDRRLFLVPLQVYNDAQVQVHSGYTEVRGFIEEVMRSFAAHARDDTALVIKHHPMDRGYTHYRREIDALVKELGLQGRCYYIHDQHMPTLMDHACGVVVINSTVGLQALRHGVPTKVLGDAIYDMKGLTHQGELADFWVQATQTKPLPALLRQFVNHLKHTNQVNGSFYKAMPNTGWTSGVYWPRPAIRPAQAAEGEATPTPAGTPAVLDGGVAASVKVAPLQAVPAKPLGLLHSGR